jgi:hypothetical protein
MRLIGGQEKTQSRAMKDTKVSKKRLKGGQRKDSKAGEKRLDKGGQDKV